MSSRRTKQRRTGVLGSLQSSFLTGLVVIAPVGLTIWLIWTIIGWIDGFVMPFVPASYQPDVLIRYFTGTESPMNVRGVGVVVFVIFTILVGWLAKGYIGRTFIRIAEGLVERMPIVRSVYSGVKQIAETVFSTSDTSFETACLIEYPRKGVWALGFVSTHAKGEVRARATTSGELLSIFLPTTPNPTSGFLLFVPAEDVIELDMSVEEAAKLVISAGLVSPEHKAGEPLAGPEVKSALTSAAAKR